ncbi:hypothetical protein GCM10009587_23260 [Microbacterium maritypicum]
MGKKPASHSAEWEAFAGELGVNLHRARIASGLSQEAVAYRAGLTRYTYQAYERGRSQAHTPANPTLFVMVALSQVLDVPLHKLLPSDLPDVTTR